MDGDESGNEEEKPAFGGGKGGDTGKGYKADYFMDARQERTYPLNYICRKKRMIEWMRT